MNALEVLQACTVQGNNVFLPEGQLDREIYKEVAKRLEGIGGKWNRKAGGFVFSTDPTDLLAEVQGGTVRNLKKEYQFFPTPDNLADYLVSLADVEDAETILEPSAGQGAIIRAIRRVNECGGISAIELMPQNVEYLRNNADKMDIWSYDIAEADFLEVAKDFVANKVFFDRVIANPPFTNNQDIDHIRAMYDVCRHRGRVVSIASIHWKTSSNRKETEFREWLDNLGAEIIDIEAGEFKESGTNVPTCIIVINK